MTAIGIWSMELVPGKPQKFQPAADIRLTNVSLGEKLQDASGRSVIKLSHPQIISNESDEVDDEDETPTLLAHSVICSLIAGKIEQSTVDIVLDEQAQYTLEVTGKNTVHLLGNYLDQRPFPPMGDDSDLDSEEAYNLEDVSSDVEMEMDPAELNDDEDEDADRFEEVKDDEPQTGAKRPLEAEESPKTSKADKKKAKKMKASDGSAVPAPSPDSKATKDKSKDAKESKDTSAKDKDKEKKKKKEPITYVTLPSGLKYTDAKMGTGPKAKKGDTVLMRYIGRLANGKIFDQNTKGKPFAFNLGKGEVIKGWDEGVVGMTAGAERVLVIPANLGYGKRGTDGIPPNSELRFEVKLIQIK